MNTRKLLFANFKRHKGIMVGSFILMFAISCILGTTLSIWNNSEKYMKAEIMRAGFGDITAWVSADNDRLSVLADNIVSLNSVESVETQKIIYSSYTINNQKSDSDGQLIAVSPESQRYKFFNSNLSGYKQSLPIINRGEVYVSPSLISMFDAQIGDEISFQIARNGKNSVLKIAGYYEDPFMGSSMIGMKGFLISNSDMDEIQNTIKSSGIDALAKNGGMIHIFGDTENFTKISDLRSDMNENTDLLRYSDFVHSRNDILEFMLILQNIFCGILVVFTVVLIIVTIIVLMHCIGGSIETDFKNIAILKAIGFTAKQLRIVQIIQYILPVTVGMMLGIFTSVFAGKAAASMMVTTTGILVPASLPFLLCFFMLAVILIMFAVFIWCVTSKINHISPIRMLQNHNYKTNSKLTHILPIIPKSLNISLALRQILSGKRRYINVFMTSMLLVIFSSSIGMMDTWLGSDGKGLMDAFNPADHDIGVQATGTASAEELKNDILVFSDIYDSYQLAMQNISLNGTDYTANVVSQPERFHILKGKTCEKDNEIVITETIAENMQLNIGDNVNLRADKSGAEYTVSGIYQCANDMGANIGISREGYLKIGQNDERIWCYHYFLTDTTCKTEIKETLETKYVSEIYIHENSWPGLEGITSAMNLMIIFMYFTVTLFILIVTFMITGKIIFSEKRDFGIYKAIGFSVTRLRMIFSMRFAVISLAGAIVGTLIGFVFADTVISQIMKLFGISNFSVNPSVIGNLMPLIIVTVMFTVFSYIAGSKIKEEETSVLTFDN